MFRMPVLAPKPRCTAVVSFVFGLAITVGCERHSSSTGNEATTSATKQSLPSESSNYELSSKYGEHLRPLKAASASVSFDLPNSSSTELRIPIGISRPATVVVVLGMEKATLSERCSIWYELTAKSQFVLCQAEPEQNLEPAGQADWYDRVLRLALRATKRRFGGYVAAETVTVVGLPAASEAVVALTRKAPAFFSRIALIQRALGSWSAVDSGRFAQISGSRALVVCDVKDCEFQALRVTATLRALGVPVRLLTRNVVPGLDSGLGLRFPDDYKESATWLFSTTDADAGAQ